MSDRMRLPRVQAWLIGCCLVLVFGMLGPTVQAQNSTKWPKPRDINPERLATAGLRVVRSKHCTMVTDLPKSAEVDRLPAVVDAGITQWAKRFELTEEQFDSWRVRVYLMKDRRRFEAQRLMPEGRDQFPDGFALGYEVWLYDQPTDYYRRHLLLHEVTHAVMLTQLGGCGPAWYMEAMAELCGTHAWDAQAGQLQLARFPADRKEAPHWGRVRLVHDAAEQRGIASIDSLMQIDNRNALAVDAYAWLWALAKFLDEHPRYQQRWRSLTKETLSRRFDQQFVELYAADREQLDQEWRLFVSRIAYGYDIRREAIDFQPGTALVSTHTVSVSADRGWQSSGVLVQAGRRYQIVGQGRCVVGQEPAGQESSGQPWPSEAGGITLAYAGGRPLGELQATVGGANAGVDAFVHSTPFGLSGHFEPTVSGTLYLRLNDAPNGLHDNHGAISATISVD